MVLPRFFLILTYVFVVLSGKLISIIHSVDPYYQCYDSQEECERKEYGSDNKGY